MGDSSMLGSTDQVFPSAIARWAAVMVWGISLMLWGCGLWALIDLGFGLEGLAAAGLGGLIGAGPLTFLYQTRYTITPSTLVIRSGGLWKRLPLTRIAGASSTLSLGVNFAMSQQDILQINVRDSRIGYRISPAARAGFLRALEQACPHLMRQDDELVLRR